MSFSEFEKMIPLIPRFILDCKRLETIKATTCDFLRRDLLIPIEWVQEYNELHKRVNKYKEKH